MVKSNRTETFACPIEQVWQTVTDLSDQSWRRDIEKVEILDERRFREYAKNGLPTDFTVIRKETGEIWAFEFTNKYLKGTWTGLFKSQNGQTVLDFTETAEVKRCLLKPLVRFYLKKQQKRYFADLRRALNTQADSRIKT